MKIKIRYPKTEDQELLESFETEVCDAVVEDLCRDCPIEWKYLNDENSYELFVKTDGKNRSVGKFGTNFLNEAKKVLDEAKKTKDDFRSQLRFLISKVTREIEKDNYANRPASASGIK